MSTFKVGEVATGQNITRHPELNGMECVIESSLVDCRIHYLDGATERTLAHQVKWADGRTQWQPPKRLRKRTPGIDKATAHLAMLGCIQRAKQSAKEPA